MPRMAREDVAALLGEVGLPPAPAPATERSESEASASWTSASPPPPTPYGRLRHLRPVVRMPATPPRWEVPTSPIGTHPAAWISAPPTPSAI